MIGTVLALLFAAIGFCVGLGGFVLIGIGVKVRYPHWTLIECAALILCAITITLSALGAR